MGTKSIRRLVVVLLAIYLLGLVLVDSSAQRRRRRTRPRRASTPRITNPAIYQPPAADEAKTNANSASSEATPPTNEDPAEKTIRDLSLQVHQLSTKNNKMETSMRKLDVMYLFSNT